MQKLRVLLTQGFLLLNILYVSVGCTGDRPVDGPRLAPPNFLEAPKQPEDYPPIVLAQSTDSVRYKMKKIHKLYKLDKKDPYSLKGEISFNFPVITGAMPDSARKKVNQAIRRIVLSENAKDIAYRSPEQRARTFIQSFKEYLREDAEFATPWEMRFSGRVSLNTTHLLGIQIEEQNFMGGAHDNFSFYTLNFVRETGQILRLDDLFIMGYQGYLLPIAERYFRKAQDIGMQENLTNYGYEFPNGEFTLAKSFMLGENALMFDYQPYEIGPYSLGRISFEVPYDAIRHLVKSDGPLR